MRLRALLDLLWEDFSGSVFTVAVKLWVAAAEDEELRERLVPVEKGIYANMARLSAEVAGELGAEPGFDRKLAIAMNTVAGLALTREFDPSGQGEPGQPVALPPGGARADARGLTTRPAPPRPVISEGACTRGAIRNVRAHSARPGTPAAERRVENVLQSRRFQPVAKVVVDGAR